MNTKSLLILAGTLLLFAAVPVVLMEGETSRRGSPEAAPLRSSKGLPAGRSAGRLSLSSPSSSTEEESQEFVAQLIEEARPQLAETLRKRVASDHRRRIEHETAALQSTLSLTDAQAREIRNIFESESAAQIASDFEALDGTPASLSRLAERSYENRRAWAERARPAVRSVLNSEQRAEFEQ